MKAALRAVPLFRSCFVRVTSSHPARHRLGCVSLPFVSLLHLHILQAPGSFAHLKPGEVQNSVNGRSVSGTAVGENAPQHVGDPVAEFNDELEVFALCSHICSMRYLM
jgi:hypothetical protein